MKLSWSHWLLCLAALIVCSGATFAPSGLTSVGPREIAAFLQVEPTRAADDRTQFETRLTAELAQKPDIFLASQKLSGEFSLSQTETQRLAQLVILVALLDKNRLFGWDENIPREEMDKREDKFKTELREAFIKLVHETKFSSIVLSAATKALRLYALECRQEDFKALVKGAGADVAYRVADEAYCTGFLVAANEQQPMNLALLTTIAGYGILSKTQRIALFEYLRIQFPAGPDHAKIDAFFAQKLISDYWDLGLIDIGINVYQSLPAEERSLVLNGQPSFETTLGGHSVRLPHYYPSPGPEPSDLHIELASALIVKGRATEARATLAATEKFGTEAKAAFTCQVARKEDCPRMAYATMQWVYLDHVLNHESDDPYDIFEQNQAGEGWGYTGLWMALLRQTMHEPAYRALVDKDIERWQPDYADTYDLDEKNAIAATLDPKIVARSAEVRKLTDDQVRAFGHEPRAASAAERTPVPAPRTKHFQEAKLPACAPSTNLKPFIIDPSKFPDGYAPVRAERQGERVVAISLSQNYDPSGEVNGGGYWVHISNDAGKTWARPLYTGLPQFFPYEVKSQSCLPLIAGDHLQIEVEIKEIDTSSIFYPPVALRVRRRQSGLYLDIALSELQEDSDGDGLTDIAEESLLLDPNKADSDGDGVPDGQDPFPNVAYTGKRSPTDGPMTAVMNELSKRGWGALIEPIERKPGELMSGWSQPSMSYDRPTFMSGNKADFSGFKAQQMTLVYSDEELAKLAAMKPDFNAMSLGPLTLNRTGARGFITWSVGWAGGMFRVIKDGQTWRVEELSNWIT